ncbi:MAG: PAS domain-containing protein [Negativicutes bacterium]|nr:PAS domain-containing protein [Negativicutes bacterium]
MQNSQKSKEQIIAEILNFQVTGSILDNVTEVIWVKDLAGHYVLVSQSFNRLYGIEREYITGKTDADFRASATAKRQILDDQAVVKNKKTMVFQEEHLLADGQTLYFETSKSPVYDNQGNVVGTIGVSRDITERKRMEDTVSYLNKQMLNILESITSGFFTLDSDWRINYVNKIAAKVFGRSPDELFGLNILDDYPQLINTTFHRNFVRVMQKRKPVHFEEHAQMHQAWYEVHVYPASGGGISVFFEDISEKKKMEQERIKLADKAAMLKRFASLGILLQGIIHELNQPLNALEIITQSALYWLESDYKNSHVEKHRENYQLIGYQLQRFKNIIGRLHDFVVSGKQEAFALVSLNDAIKRVAGTLQPQLSLQKIELRLDLAKGLPAMSGSPISVEEVIMNIVINAIQALGLSEKQGKFINITTVNDNGHVVLVISNNGPKIPRNVQAQVFEPLFTTKGPHCTGLGLAIVHSIVIAHNGLIKVTSNNNLTTFRISFPVAL